MGFIIGLLTVVMVLDCAVLVLLVLLQLPKKDAGAGLAFGGAATDALFGAGSGNVLTNITKYAATIFFILAVLLSILQSRYHRRGGTDFERKLSQPAAGFPAAPAAPAVAPTAASNAAPRAIVEDTNIPARPVAPPPAAPATPAPAPTK
jgi:preprotein translocase subunit SecG